MDEKVAQENSASAEQFHRETVIQVPLSDLYPFPGHPFKVRDDEAMRGMVESIKEYGVLTPAILRPRAEDGYEIVSGHRRKYACSLAGLDTLPAIVRELDDDTATILMVDSNIQRENLLPSEKAQAYKMKMEALKRQGARTDLTSPQVAAKFRSDDEVAKDAGISGDTVRRYIRLTELSPELQQLVDTGDLPITPAVEISYLDSEEQAMLKKAIDTEQVIPSLSQAQQLKKSSQKGSLNQESIRSILTEKPKSEPVGPLSVIPKYESASPPMADDIARLKDPTKECRCTPEIFLESFTEFIDRYCGEIKVFRIPYYEQVFPLLSAEQMDTLYQQIKGIHAAADSFYQQVKGLNKHEQSPKPAL